MDISLFEYNRPLRFKWTLLVKKSFKPGKFIKFTKNGYKPLQAEIHRACLHRSRLLTRGATLVHQQMTLASIFSPYLSDSVPQPLLPMEPLSLTHQFSVPLCLFGSLIHFYLWFLLLTILYQPHGPFACLFLWGLFYQSQFLAWVSTLTPYYYFASILSLN